VLIHEHRYTISWGANGAGEERGTIGFFLFAAHVWARGVSPAVVAPVLEALACGMRAEVQLDLGPTAREIIAQHAIRVHPAVTDEASRAVVCSEHDDAVARSWLATVARVYGPEVACDAPEHFRWIPVG
jgi:glycosyltransferase involved in cell wall biosynthesis